jgi:hypothetical protein
VLVASADRGSLQTLATSYRFRARGAGGDRRAPKPQARGAPPQSRPQRRAVPVKNCPSRGANCVPLLRFRKSVQRGASGHSAGGRSARRRCALETVKKIVTGNHTTPRRHLGDTRSRHRKTPARVP